MNHLQDEDGIRSIPTITTWRSIREDIAAAFESVAGPLPSGEKCDLAMKVEEEVDCGSYVRQLITYAATENCRTPAYLCIPKTCLSDAPTRAPAVLCLHGTDQEVGHGTVVGLSDRENRSYASELAERGFVTLAPSYPLLANYQEEPAAHGFESGTMMAIHDNMRGLDLLDTLPFVANQTPPRPPNLNGTALPGDYYEWGSGGGHYMPGKYGAIGHSSAPPSATPLPPLFPPQPHLTRRTWWTRLGGHNSVYTALFDPRLAVVVSSCGLDSYRDYMDGDVTGWTQIRYLPKILDLPLIEGSVTHAIPWDFHDLVAAIAPRPCLLSAPLHDSNFKWDR